MYKYLLLMLITLPLSATDSRDLIIEKLLKEVQELKLSVEELKKNQIIVQTRQNENKKYIDEVYDFAEETETRTLEDKLKFGVAFKTSVDNFTKKYSDGHKVNDETLWSNKLMLNAKADITKDMKLYTRLSMYKYWGNGLNHLYRDYDNMQGRVPSDSSLFVERAYLDWFLNQDGYIPMAVTIGRQPSADGPSHQFKDNISRKATYSSLLYDGAGDGVVFTFDISKLIENKKTFLRLGYAKGFAYLENSIPIGNASVGASDNNLEDTDVYGIFFDTTIPNIRKSLIQLSYSKIDNIIANQLDTDSFQNKNIGDTDMYGAMIELSDIKNSNLDLFLHYGHIKAHPNSNSYLNYGGLLSAVGDTSTKSGDAIWLGTRYGFGDRQKYKIGLEYNQGSENWVSLTQGSSDVYNKLSTRGEAYEAYLMYVINRYANIRLGYIDITYDHTGSGIFIGKSMNINDIPNPEELKELQSVYLKMSVNY
ncbi:MAG: DUF3373 family protein [Campylobacterota bacterium]|nr:DUF3373 family protein [Campylobacterota bacterium]